MEQEETRWSESRLGLTAPESYVLVYGPKAGGGRPFELALMELVVGGRLILTNATDRGPLGLWSKNVALLAPNPEERPSEGRPLSSLLDLLDEIPPRTTRDGKTGVPITRLVREARRKYGWLAGYAEAEVIPGLASRRLYERREIPVVGARWQITRAGEATRAELEKRLFHFGAERLSLSYDENPTRALAYLGIAGSSVLLMEQLRPQLQRLHEQQVAGGPYPGAEVGFEGVFDHDDPEAGWQDAFDNLDLGALDLDIGAFDGLAETISGVDFGGGGGGGGGA